MLIEGVDFISADGTFLGANAEEMFGTFTGSDGGFCCSSLIGTFTMAAAPPQVAAR